MAAGTSAVLRPSQSRCTPRSAAAWATASTVRRGTPASSSTTQMVCPKPSPSDTRCSSSAVEAREPTATGGSPPSRAAVCGSQRSHASWWRRDRPRQAAIEISAGEWSKAIRSSIARASESTDASTPVIATSACWVRSASTGSSSSTSRSWTSATALRRSFRSPPSRTSPRSIADTGPMPTRVVRKAERSSARAQRYGSRLAARARRVSSSGKSSSIRSRWRSACSSSRSSISSTSIRHSASSSWNCFSAVRRCCHQPRAPRIGQASM